MIIKYAIENFSHAIQYTNWRLESNLDHRSHGNHQLIKTRMRSNWVKLYAKFSKKRRWNWRSLKGSLGELNSQRWIPHTFDPFDGRKFELQWWNFSKDLQASTMGFREDEDFLGENFCVRVELWENELNKWIKGFI